MSSSVPFSYPSTYELYDSRPKDLSILIIEDNQYQASLLKKSLEGVGFRSVDIVSSYRETKRIFTSEESSSRYDVFIIDLFLPAGVKNKEQLDFGVYASVDYNKNGSKKLYGAALVKQTMHPKYPWLHNKKKIIYTSERANYFNNLHYSELFNAELLLKPSGVDQLFPHLYKWEREKYRQRVSKKGQQIWQKYDQIAYFLKEGPYARAYKAEGVKMGFYSGFELFFSELGNLDRDFLQISKNCFLRFDLVEKFGSLKKENVRNIYLKSGKTFFLSLTSQFFKKNLEFRFL